MKKRLASQLALGFSLVALPFLDGGCTQPNAGGSDPFINSANAEPASTENDLEAVATTATNVPMATAEVAANDSTHNASDPGTTAPALAGNPAENATPPTESKPPANLYLTPVLSEAVKLVQSGVEKSVLFAYVTNTTGYFSLGADQIVYLNDLGVDADLITTMMEHDKALRDLRMNAWQAAQATSTPPAAPTSQSEAPAPAPAPEPETVAAAPSYVEAPAMQAEPVYVSNNYFYDTLSPYGSWIYVTGYGRCWRPTVAICNPGWRPYVDRGHWVYSDCGWYWLSDYTWGATAFHYGRWFNAPGTGWCWWPDTVWAPSWVSWRYNSGYCGWAPLPPTAGYQAGFGLMYSSGSVGISFGFGLGYADYAFVPWGSFCGPQPYRYCVPASQAVQVYNHSTPVNHLEAGGPGQVYNRGIDPTRVRQYSRAEVRTVHLSENPGKGLRKEQLTRNGRTLEVHRPQFTTASTRTASPVGNSPRVGGRELPAQTRAPVLTKSSDGSRTTPSRVPDRIESQSRHEQVTIGRAPTRPNLPLTQSGTPETYTGRMVTPRTRTELRKPTVPAPAPQPPTESVADNRSPVTSPRAPTGYRPALPGNQRVTSPVVKPTQPREIESRPVTPAQNNSVVIFGGRNNSRPSGRDYSVWSTTRRESPVRVVPEVAENSPAPISRPQSSDNWRDRGNSYNQSESRGSYRTYSTPSVRREISPAPRPTPVYNQSRPAGPSRVTPSYTPRAQPAPAMSAPRSEPRPTPAAPRPSNPSPPAR